MSGYTGDDDFVCGEAFDHDLPEPDFVDGVAVLMCRGCGAELFIEEEETECPPPPTSSRLIGATRDACRSRGGGQ